MAKQKILHMVTPDQNVSPFDVNMAVDAGYQQIFPYTGITSESEVASLVQDAIFSRSPGNASSTGMFIGGFDVNLAAEMLNAAKKAMVPPFELSVFADPNGAYTTAGALVALIVKILREKFDETLNGKTVKVFGGGPVGLCAAILAAQANANVSLVRLTESARMDSVTSFASRYNLELLSESATSYEQRAAAALEAQIIICTAKAGIQILDNRCLECAKKLAVAADVNAVPPAGIESVGLTDSGQEVQMSWGSFYAIGALGIGKVKYDVQNQLLKKMLESDKALVLDFPEAYELAGSYT